MFVATLVTDLLDRDGNHGAEIHEPELDQIESAIHQLDGKSRTTVMLETGGIAYMAISASEHGQYLVSARCPDNSYFVLTQQQNSTAESAKVRFSIGGQESDFPAEQCVDLVTALQAAGTFAVDGTLNPSLAWKRLG